MAQPHSHRAIPRHCPASHTNLSACSLQETHPRAAECIAQQIDGRYWCAKQVVRKENQHPVFDDSRNIHCQRACLSYQEKHCLHGSHVCCEEMQLSDSLQKQLSIQQLQVMVEVAVYCSIPNSTQRQPLHLRERQRGRSALSGHEKGVPTPVQLSHH